MRRPLRALSLAALSVTTVCVATVSVAAAAAERVPFAPADVAALRELSDPRVSPEGDWVAYVVGASDLEKDQRTSELWMVSWDGRRRVQLTSSEASESAPRWSPDGRYLGFLAARGEDAESQVWLLDRAGGEARALTDLPGGVSDFAWSPDSGRLALIAHDPDPRRIGPDGEKREAPKTAPPIVVDRYQFKQDRVGYLGEQRDHLYLFELETRRATPLTRGAFDDQNPAWSPDGTRIAFSSKRGADPDRHGDWNLYLIEAVPGAEERPLTSWPGADASSGAPAWSPDGRSIAYLRGAAPKYADYDPSELALIELAGGEPRLLAPGLDRWVNDPVWSEDGAWLYFLLEDDRSQQLARVPAAGGEVERLDSTPGVSSSLTLGGGGRIAALLTRGEQPAELFARDGDVWRALTDHNRELLDRVALGRVEGISFESRDGTRIGALLVKPPGFEPGRRYPTIAYIHGGPVGQDGFEFDLIWQVLAARGYLVIAPNYRGSSGRGRDFSRAIYADWGRLEVQDVLAGVDHLVAEGLADPQRLGIGGWSYGGMTTNYAISSDPRFKAAVSGAGIANMIAGYGTDQYIRQYEHEVGLPWGEIDTYLKISYPFFRADRIRTPTLFLCGEKDFNVPLINSEQMYQALRSLGVDTRLVIYPGQYHSIRTPSYLRDRLQRTLEWFDRYLQP